MIADRKAAPRRPLVEWLSLGFVLLAVALALLVPENAYDNVASLRAIAEWVATILPSINEFARISSFPGVTKVVLAALWICVIPLAYTFHSVPGIIVWDSRVVQRLGRAKWGVVLMILVFTVVMPVVLTLDEHDLRSPLTANLIIKFASTSRLGLGLVGGAYCATASLLLALLPKFLRR